MRRKATMVALGVLWPLACGDAPSAPSEFPQVAGFYVGTVTREGLTFPNRGSFPGGNPTLNLHVTQDGATVEVLGDLRRLGDIPFGDAFAAYGQVNLSGNFLAQPPSGAARALEHGACGGVTTTNLSITFTGRGGTWDERADTGGVRKAPLHREPDEDPGASDHLQARGVRNRGPACEVGSLFHPTDRRRLAG